MASDFCQKCGADTRADRLCFAAYQRCRCGCGMAYDPNGILTGYLDKYETGRPQQWECSAVLLGEGNGNQTHTAPLPFVSYEIKSENQPSVNGETTRKNPIHKCEYDKRGL